MDKSNYSIEPFLKFKLPCHVKSFMLTITFFISSLCLNLSSWWFNLSNGKDLNKKIVQKWQRLEVWPKFSRIVFLSMNETLKSLCCIPGLFYSPSNTGNLLFSSLCSFSFWKHMAVHFHKTLVKRQFFHRAVFL